MTDLEKMIGNEVKELKTLYDMSEAEYDRRSEEGENICKRINGFLQFIHPLIQLRVVCLYTLHLNNFSFFGRDNHFVR